VINQQNAVAVGSGLSDVIRLIRAEGGSSMKKGDKEQSSASFLQECMKTKKIASGECTRPSNVAHEC
jgi:hypothetical protein